MPPKMPFEKANGNLQEGDFVFDSPSLEQQLADAKQQAEEAERRATVAEARVEDYVKVWSLELIG